MTRDDIERDYSVVNGQCTAPGQFCGEAVWVPHFWFMHKMGMNDGDDGILITFVVTDEDRAVYPELSKVRIVRLYESKAGPICGIATCKTTGRIAV